MARTLLVSTTVSATETVSPAGNALDLVEAAGDVANGNYFVWNGKQVILAHNTGVGARTITVEADADAYGRDGAITAYSIGADEKIAIPVCEPIWKQTSDNDRVYVDVEHAEVKLIVLSLARL